MHPADDPPRTQASDRPTDQPPPVQHCPWCGEHIGSFWGRREADGGHWCESCQRFFAVTELT